MHFYIRKNKFFVHADDSYDRPIPSLLYILCHILIRPVILVHNHEAGFISQVLNFSIIIFIIRLLIRKGSVTIIIERRLFYSLITSKH